MNDFIILNESEFIDEVQAYEPTLDRIEVDELVNECVIYGSVWVENDYIEAVKLGLEEFGYEPYITRYTEKHSYIKI